MKEITLTIGGMHCDGCVVRVRNLLAKVEGIQVKEVRLGSAHLLLPGGEQPLTAAADCLRKAGYDVSVNAG